MPPASGTGEPPRRPDHRSLTPAPALPRTEPGTPAPDPVLAAERAHLSQSREFLRLMRENVLALASTRWRGDRVSPGVPQGRPVPPGRGAEGPAGRAAVLRPARLRRGGDDRDVPAEGAGTAGAATAGSRADRRCGAAGRAAAHRAASRARPGRPPGRDRLAGAGVPALLPGQPVRPDGPDAAAPVRLRRRELTAYEDEGFTGGAARPRATEPGQPHADRGDRAAAVRARCATSWPPSSPSRTTSSAPTPTTTVCVQGAPGTGKTAVGLHRVAYLLYAHQEPDDPGRRPRHRAEPGLPLLHPQRAARARRARRHPDDRRRPGRHRPGPGRRYRRDGAGQGRRPDGGGAAPGAVGRAARARRGARGDPRVAAAGGCPRHEIAELVARAARARRPLRRRPRRCSRTASRT